MRRLEDQLWHSQDSQVINRMIISQIKFDPHTVTGSEAELEPYSLYPARSSRDARAKVNGA
jgi:hypothetical protein